MSLKRIAEMVGTSASTVSRVLNNSYSTCASAELKDRIWEAAHEIGYVPNASARRLKLGGAPEKRALSLSVVFARVNDIDSDPFFGELHRSLQADAMHRGYAIDRTVSADDALRENLAESDGIVVAGRCSSDMLDKLKGVTPNIVGIWRNPMNYEVDEVVCDGRKAANIAMDDLIARGHRRIAYIGDCSGESRYVGYMEAMMEHQIPLDYSLVAATSQTQDSGREAMAALLRSESTSAVLCANDATALGALSALREAKGLGSRKVAVISIDDIEEAGRTTPALTTVRIPREDMAHTALSVLEDRIRGGHVEKLRVEFPCRIVERDSCPSH
ncbi:MAG: LacI family DNA-binding transcriptional regulator [Eggerthellaceae bacterium]|nr:LacI family DNA-binding transcriptional regulator [Eggerthellaceae bacterium]